MMLRKLKKRYLIANMTLLTSTLLISLTILFLLLYRAEVNSSYEMMHDMLEYARLSQSAPTPERPPQNAPMIHTESSSEQSVVTALAHRDFYWGDWSVTSFTTATTTTTETLWTDATTLSGTESATEPDDWCWHQYDKHFYHGDYGYYMPPYWVFSDIHPNPGDNDDWKPSDDKAPWGNPPNVPPPPFPPFGDPAVTTKPQYTTPSEITTTTVSKQTKPPKQTTPPLKETDPTEQTSSSVSSITTTIITQTTAASGDSAITQTTTTQSQNPIVTVNDSNHYLNDAYIAQIEANGQISSFTGGDENADSDEDLRTMHHAVNAIQKRKEPSGTIEVNDTPYRYLYQPDHGGGYQLVLLNRTLELSMLSRMLLVFILLTVFGLACMFGISVLLANWTVRPIAKAWNKQKQFVADASHELKTPLAVISANTEVILANPDASVMGQSKWLHYIKSETLRMSKLVTDLLSVARMDQNTIAEPSAVIRFHELVSNICLSFEPIIYENGKTLNTVIQRNVTMQGDEDNIRQLLSILLDNAVLHSTNGAEITVTLSRDAQEKIRLAVSNTAEDIPKEQLSHLFERFYRLDKTGAHNGSGLGLSIAKSIVENMKGVLTVHSENHLITFVATFPA
ncbi:MAG: HAMP domain-containing histidine kinase [Oscillospiraceae bacterium]|nr:HAMP domain-containing histidine kinase [Oscillospiraceae bacterium]